jgi:hypothetical protein
MLAGMRYVASHAPPNKGGDPIQSQQEAHTTGGLHRSCPPAQREAHTEGVVLGVALHIAVATVDWVFHFNLCFCGRT